jgi:hypothetical protein
VDLDQEVLEVLADLAEAEELTQEEVVQVMLEHIHHQKDKMVEVTLEVAEVLLVTVELYHLTEDLVELEEVLQLQDRLWEDQVEVEAEERLHLEEVPDLQLMEVDQEVQVVVQVILEQQTAAVAAVAEENPLHQVDQEVAELLLSVININNGTLCKNRFK